MRLASEGKIQQFDYIYTNPPWGKKLTKDEKKYLGRCFKVGASVDTCSLFFFASLEQLKSDGTLGFLLPEAFFNIAAFEHARIKSLSLMVERLVDYGKPFKGLLTKAQGIILSNSPMELDRQVKCESEGKSIFRSVGSFSRNPKSIFNQHCDQNSADTLEFLLSIPHITLDRRASWGLGIVTGNNKKFIQNTPRDGFVPVFIGSDILQGGLKEPSNYIPADLGLYQQVAPVRLFEAEKS